METNKPTEKTIGNMERYTVQDHSGDHRPSPGFTWRGLTLTEARVQALYLAEQRRKVAMDVDIRIIRESDDELMEEID